MGVQFTGHSGSVGICCRRGSLGLVIAAVVVASLACGGAEAKKGGSRISRWGSSKKRTHPVQHKKAKGRAVAPLSTRKTTTKPNAGEAEDTNASETNNRRRRSSRQNERQFPAKAALVGLADFVGLCCGCLIWCIFLEYQPEPSLIRSCMLAATGISYIIDLSLCYLEVVQWWLGFAMLFVSVWGALDAALRFPVVPGLDSLFSLKQMCLAASKVVIYTLGMKNIYESKLLFISFIIFNVAGMPVMYILALPDSYLEPPKSSAAMDVDIAVHFWGTLSNKEERRQFILCCKRRMLLAVLVCGKLLPGPLQDALGRVAPWYRRAVQIQKGRRV